MGVELGGALKNVMALCTGSATVWGSGQHQGHADDAGPGRDGPPGRPALGARKDTFAGLAGMGDLIVTCTSMHSRNHRAGILIGQGTPSRQAIRKIGAVVEGYYAVDSARELAAQAGVEMPITLAAYDVLYRDRDPREVLLSLMRREKRHEIEETWF